MAKLWYCADCDCNIESDQDLTIAGCVQTQWNDGTQPEGVGGGGNGTTPDASGAGTGLTPGWLPFGMPFGAGVEDFFKDFFKNMCKYLPDGLCEKARKIFWIIVIILIAIAALWIYSKLKKK